MAKSTFIGRSEELELLDSLWSVPRATLLILYGRRRVGKTRLLTHWLKRHGAYGLYWMAEATSAREQLRSFSQAIIHFIDPDTPTPSDFSYATWEQALRQVALHTKERRMALIIDEVTYLMEVNSSFVGILQKTWDHWLADSNLMLALSGSQMGMMQKKILAYDAPLYGRDTAQLKLPPMPFSATRKFFPNYSDADRVAIYTMWGGVPAYWERMDLSLPVMENLRRQLLSYQSWMTDESRTLLNDFITEPHNYVAVLRAIADGLQTSGEISQRVGLASNELSFYLSKLREAGFVVREVPVRQINYKNSRSGRYFVTDPYLRFYYRFLAAYQSRLALGQQQQVAEAIEKALPEFIEKNTWRELCRQWLMEASHSDILPVPIEHVGSEWKSDFMIDVVGIDNASKSLIIGDCFWREDPIDAKSVEKLIRKTSTILPDHEGWTVYYLVFSANGWTAKAESQVQTFIEKATSRARKSWETAGIRLVTLDQVSSDLDRWSSPDGIASPKQLHLLEL
ncbi:MAG: ATP-binding protein [Candidatus Promineifilaceae bacterium]|nr:ATP-binding protein [Candidatus Promineifilaceae bacterium]